MSFLRIFIKKLCRFYVSLFLSNISLSFHIHFKILKIQYRKKQSLRPVSNWSLFEKKKDFCSKKVYIVIPIADVYPMLPNTITFINGSQHFHTKPIFLNVCKNMLAFLSSFIKFNRFTCSF